MNTVAIVPAAGLGERMGADKALLELGGCTAIERVAATCRAAGCDEVLVVRRAGAAALPAAAGVRVVTVPPGGEMADSLRAANAALGTGVAKVVVFPVDHALVEADTTLALLTLLERPGVAVALPLFRDRPGHPIALRREAFAGIAAPGATLRDLVRADSTRVRVLPSANPWVHADLDHPADLRDARCALRAEPRATVAQMFRHRSRRSFRPDPVPQEQLERLVDAARFASTSNLVQAYSVVAVRDPAHKAACAKLCADQQQIHEAPLFLAICVDLHKMAVACERHGEALQTQSLELFLMATIDASLLGQNLLLAAESEGLGGCMIGAARNHPLELAKLLALPKHAFVLFGMTLGVPADDPVDRGRMPLSGVLHHERYDPAAAVGALEGADVGMRQWAREANLRQGGYQGKPVSETKGWTDRVAATWGRDSAYLAARKHFLQQLRELGFGCE